MNINTQFSVSLHILALMAKSPDAWLNSSVLAESVQTNPVVIRRLLQELGQAGLVTTKTGADGGARLAKEPGKIILSDVFAAVNQAPLFAVYVGLAKRDAGAKLIKRALESVLKEQERKFSQNLSKVTLRDILSAAKKAGIRG